MGRKIEFPKINKSTKKTINNVIEVQDSLKSLVIIKENLNKIHKVIYPKISNNNVIKIKEDNNQDSFNDLHISSVNKKNIVDKKQKKTLLETISIILTVIVSLIVLYEFVIKHINI